MTMTTESFTAAGKAGLDASIAIAQTQFAAAEKYASLSINTAKASFDDASAHLRAVVSTQDPQEIARLNGSAAQPALQKAATYVQSVYDVATEAQANLTKFVEAQGVEFNRTFANTIDAIAKNAPAGSDGAINAMKSSFAAWTSACDGWSKFAKQTSEVAEANFTKVTKAVAKGR